MSEKFIIFITFIFIMGTFLSLIMEGAYFSSEEAGIINNLTGFSIMEIERMGILTIPKLALGFLMNGLPKVIMWDYSFLEGEWMIIKWILLYPISASVVYGIIKLFIPAVTGIFRR